MTNLFVYGTLQAEEVVKALIGRVPAMRSGDGPALLHEQKCTETGARMRMS